MSTGQGYTAGPQRPRRLWLKEEIILGTLGAFLAFAFLYAYTGDADLYYPFAGALGMGALTYAIVWLTALRIL